MSLQKITEHTNKSKADASAITVLAQDVISNMDAVLKLVHDLEPNPEPIPPQPEPIPKDVVNIQSFGIKPIDEQINGYEFKDVYHNGITIRNSNEKVFYLIFATQTGEKTFENILTNDNPTTFNFKDTGAYILKNDNGQFKLEIAKSWISEDKFNGYDFSKSVIYIPSGTYIHFQGHGINTLFFAERNQPLLIKGGNNTTLLGISNNPDREIPRIDCKLDSIKLHNIIPSTGTRTRNRDIYLNNVELNFGSITLTSTYIILKDGNGYLFANNLKMKCNEIYTGVWVEKASNVIIVDSEIDVKHSSHPIRINSCDNSCTVFKTKVNNSTTGIQIATQRRQLIKNAVIANCEVSGCTEESISIDSFGNNTSLVPVIAKAKVFDAEYWIEHGFKLGSIITLDGLMFVEGNPTDGYKHKSVSPEFVGDCSKYLFVIEGGQLAYQYTEIADYAIEDGKIVLYINQFYDAIDLIGEEIGLHTGALNCVIQGNTVKDARPKTSQPGHAVSLWGASYGCQVLDNKIDNCKQGIHVAGFGSFGLTEPDFFNYTIGNVVDGNKIQRCDESFAFRSFYGNRDGFQNRFTKNNVKGGTYETKNQKLFIFENNKID